MGSYRPKQYEFISQNGDTSIFELSDKEFCLNGEDDNGEEMVFAVWDKEDIPDLIKMLEEINNNL